MSNSSLLPVLIIFVIGILLLAVRVIRPQWAVAIYIERMQLIVFPLFLIALWTAQVKTFRISRMALAVAALCGVGVTGYGYLHVGRGSGEVVLFSRFQNDPDEGITSIFRERVHYFQRLGLAAVHAGPEFPINTIPRFDTERYYKSFSSDLDARNVFAKEQHLAGIVWGDTQIVKLAFPDRSPIAVGNYGHLNLAPSTTGLLIVDSVPLMTLPFEPRESSAFFVGKVFEGLSNPLTINSARFDRDYISHYTSLHLASDVAVLYRSRAHRAFAFWRAGTDSLLRYLHSGALEQGYLDCAIDDLSAANSMLKYQENPELHGAIRNNLGVATALTADTEALPEKIKEAKDWFKGAMLIRKQRSIFGETFKSFRVAGANLRQLQGAKKPKKVKGPANGQHRKVTTRRAK